ncbi:MAG: PASTA domain-containing protein [Candidatus Aminicenantes bacterium]|nr:PASTA domain-containing protein [Candidatus Aminicenantes bacterium]
MGNDKSYWYLDVINVLLLMLIFFFSGAVISSQIILNGEIVYVPDITGKTIEQARTELKKRDLGLVVSGFQFSNEVPKNRIITQYPAPGSRIKVNQSISVIISSGSESVLVPNFVGKSLEEAVSLMRRIGLNRGLLSQIHSPRYPAGRIIAQFPSPDTEVERNSQVNFLVSQGESEPTFLMPDFIGKNVDRVVTFMKKAGFKVEDIRYVYYPGLEKGVIIKQSPPGGYPIQKRNPIHLEVSR